MRARTPAPMACLAIAMATGLAAHAADLRAGEASAAGAMDGDEARVRATLYVDRDPGSAIGRVGVHFEMDPGWHIYWRNPGDAGLAPVLRFDFGDAPVERGEIAWPAPEAFDEDVDIRSYGYAGDVLLAAPVQWGEGAQGASVRAFANVLVCADQCIPATFELSRPLAAPAEGRERARALFERDARRVPSDARERGIQVALREAAIGEGPGAGFTADLEVTPCPAAEAECPLGPPAGPAEAFFPYAPESLALRSTTIERGARSFHISLAGEVLAPVGERAVLRGVIRLADRTSGARAFEVALPLEAAGTLPGGAASSPRELLRAILFGLLGGLLLNLMPCVLPVLAIKVCAVAELAQRDRQEVVAHAAAYTAGILTTLLALALCVVALRWSGTAVGWGFHLQEPVFVVVVASVLVVFAMNLVGAFEFGVVATGLAQLGASAAGARRSFFDGLLAVVLATPCSAPFLGTAVGFAFASGAPVIVAIFLAIGLGLASPFVAVAIAPGWSRFMPRSGPWMLELRRGLGFALLATVVWLLWIVGRASGTDAMAGLLILLLTIAFAAWVFGLVQRSRPAHGALLVAGVALLVMGGLDRIDLRPGPGKAAAEPTRDAPIPFSPAALSEALAAGRPSLVYFTADWCLTCKLNEARVLVDPRVRELLAREHFAVLRADWTRRDEGIRRELARLGKAGVPVYALYRPGVAAPRLLPELLRLDPFLNALAETAEEVRRAAAP